MSARPKGAPKTVNKVLMVLSGLVKKAVEWGALDRMPCTIKALPNLKKSAGFHDIEEYARLLAIARKRDLQVSVMVLLGGDAGLRLGRGNQRGNTSDAICN